MAELPPTPGDNVAQVSLPSQISPNDVAFRNPKCSIPSAGCQGINPMPTTSSESAGKCGGQHDGALSGYGPHGAGACFGIGAEPSGYGYQCLRPAQPQLQLEVNNVNGFVESMCGWQQNNLVPHQPTSVLGLVRRGTGVFHPLPRTSNNIPNNRPSKNKSGKRNNKQGGEVTRQGQRSRNSSKVDHGQDHHHHLSSEMGLPMEWTY